MLDRALVRVLRLGARKRAADALVREGHRVRIHVPFGERGREYSLRRLQENPRMTVRPIGGGRR